MSSKEHDNKSEIKHEVETTETQIDVRTDFSEVASESSFHSKSTRQKTSSERQLKIERARKCLENAAKVSKRIKEQRKATAELLDRTFDEKENVDVSIDSVSLASEKTGDDGSIVHREWSVPEALSMPGISESLSDTLRQKDILMEKIKQSKARQLERSKKEKQQSLRRPSHQEVMSTATLPGIKETIETAESTRGKEFQEKLKEKDAVIFAMQHRINELETNVVDLQDKCSEKDSLLQAKAKATSVMTENLSKKESDALCLLEYTKLQMKQMHENFLLMENQMKEEQKQLMQELEAKNHKILHLEEANSILENFRIEASLAQSKLIEEILEKEKEIEDLQAKLTEYTVRVNTLEEKIVSDSKEEKETGEEKGSIEISNMEALTKKIELLEQLNCGIRQANIDLETKLANTMKPQAEETKPQQTPVKKPAQKQQPKRSKSTTRSPATKLKSPWTGMSEPPAQQLVEKERKPAKSDGIKGDIAKMETVIQALNKELLDKECALSEKEIAVTEKIEVISRLESLLQNYIEEKAKVEESQSIAEVKVNTVETLKASRSVVQSEDGVNVNVSQLLVSDEVDSRVGQETISSIQAKLDSALEQIASLTSELDAANKNMVKVKSNNKIKLKNLQKTIDNFSKMSDANAEIVKLNAEGNELSQRVAELEEDKGNLQLHLVDYDSGRLSDSQMFKKLTELEAMADIRLKAISELESQKFDLVQELHLAQQRILEMEDKLADLSQLQSEHVCTAIASVQLEEQLDQATLVNCKLETVIQNLKEEMLTLNNTISQVESEKAEQNLKLEHYIQENIDLTDRIEKLSTEKVSSAESIEIVESLTTQEKLEIEQYGQDINMGQGTHPTEPEGAELNESLIKLSQESAELNKKIELFTLERCEVMEKMDSMKNDNEELKRTIDSLKQQLSTLEDEKALFAKDKVTLMSLNEDVTQQIEILKKENIKLSDEKAGETQKDWQSDDRVEPVEVSKESSEVSTSATEEKASSKVKNAKQLTKEILKLKNVIKEREGEIADCQMQILSMKELNTKQLETIQGIQALEQKVKALSEENVEFKLTIDKNKAYEDNSSDFDLLADELQSQRELNNQLQNRLDTLQSEYENAVLERDNRIQEIEYLLQDNQQQVLKFNETLSHKDKEICEYLNQVSQLNSVSQKLKSTIEVLEEEKANDQNVELIRGLNKQITYLQNVIGEQELKIKHYEDDQKKLSSMKLSYEERVKLLEGEIRKLNESLMENDIRIKELQELKDNNVKDIVEFSKQCKEKDEEIHEIKLQLRRESIEHETLRKSLSEVNEMKGNNEKHIAALTAKYSTTEDQLKQVNESFSALEAKNKELMEKLKKFVVNLKKKSAMCVELESKVNALNAELESKQLEIQNALSSMGQAAEHQVQVTVLQNELETVKREAANLNDAQIRELELKLQEALNHSSQLSESKAVLNTNLNEVTRSYENLKIQYENMSDINKKLEHEQISVNAELERLNNRIADYEMEQKNSSNLLTKISALEKEIGSKQSQISELLTNLDNLQGDYNNFKFGHEAKLQERDLYIENLETDIGKHKQRISRLEESISVMEDRRYSLERKADQLGSQLQEKQKAYTEYSNSEDELINRLAVLMDHDKVVEKQLHEIEIENAEMQNKLQKFIDDNQQLQHNLGLAQSELNSLREIVNKSRHLEEEHLNATHKINDLESQLKKMIADQDKVLKQKQDDIEFLEGEFHIQVENAHKEKKSLSERCERLTEQLQSLQREMVEEKAKLNAVLLENENIAAKIQQYEWEKRQTESSPPKIDYTDDLVNEINNLQATIVKKNSEIETYHKQVSQLQVARDQALARPPVIDDQALVSFQTALSEKEQEIGKLNSQFQSCLSQLRDASETEQQLKAHYHELVKSLAEKDRMIDNLKFQSNQMAVEESISSQMISLEQGQVPAMPMFDMSSLDDQIVTPEEIQHSTDHCDKMIRSFAHNTKLTGATAAPRSQKLQAAYEPTEPLREVLEDIIIPKKAYDCFDDSEHNVVKRETAASQASAFFTETDPFNSDEGWGFGDSSADVSELPVQQSLLSQQETTTIIKTLEEQVLKLTESNEKLNNDFSQCNTRLMKAMKKLKEFKIKNDTITNELNMSKQLSQMNSLDMVIQEELASQIKTLEEKVEGLETDSNKDKQEKQSLLNRIDVLTAANEKLIEVKEKLDNEVALWKFKFKELNDKLSSVEWGDEKTEEVKSAPVTQSKLSYDAPRDSEIERLNLIIDGLEKENEDLNSFIEESRETQKDLVKHSQEASKLQFELNKNLEEIANLRQQVAELTNKLEALRNINNQLNGENVELKSANENLSIKYNEVKLEIENRDKELQNPTETQSKHNDELKTVNAKLANEINEIRSLYDNLFVECSGFKDKCNDVQNEYDALTKEHKEVINEYNKTKEDLDEALSNLERSVAELESKAVELESLRSNASKLEAKVQELETRLVKLNEENGSLLSTVAELGSSVTTAVDQRGFEVAEMWKQHLNERETDFARVEFELQKQLKVSQEKYEQLLAHVQNTSLDEANKLVAVEQVSTLQDKLNDRDGQLQRLQLKFDEDLAQMEAMRSEMADEKILIENKLLAQQDEYEKQISDAEIKYKDLISEKDNSLETLSRQLSAALADDARRLTVIDSLNQKLNELCLQQQDYEMKFTETESKYRKASSELEGVQRQLADSVITIEKLTNAKDESSTLLAQDDEREKAISELELKYTNLLSETENQLQRLSYELAQAHTLSSENSRIAEDLSIARDTIVHLESRVQQSESAAFALQTSVSELHTQYRQKEAEIFTKDHEYSILLSQRNEELDMVRQQLVAAEKKVEDVTFEKESELASMRLKLHDLKESFEREILNLENVKREIQEALGVKIEECKALNIKIDDLNKLLEEEAGQMVNMRAALENQELEIVSLKDELEAVLATLRKSERHVTFSSDTKAPSDDTRQQGMDKDAIESATKAELDLALYMLHQRDVRCEELTVELTHLLEERDTLQLRLSDALRACEDVRQRVEGGSERTVPDTVESAASSGVVRESERPVGTHKTPVARSSSLSEADEAAEKGGLQNKLWELRSVSHRRDVQLRGEQEQRYREMALLQRDVAHMPPEAADRLRDAHYTLSRDSQSASTVLLNWLRGKSTPKVVHM